MLVGCFRGYSGCNGLEEGPPLQSPHHHMVEGLGRVEAGLAGHGDTHLPTSRHRMPRPPRTLAGLSCRRIKQLRFRVVARLASFRLPANPAKSLTPRPPNVHKCPNLEVTPVVIIPLR